MTKSDKKIKACKRNIIPCEIPNSPLHLSSFMGGILKDIDLKILNVLHTNARMSNIDLAKVVGASEATVRRRIQYMIEQEIIQGFSVNINYNKMGSEFIEIVVYIQVEEKQINDLIKLISPMPEAYYVHRVVGDSCNVVCGMVFPDLVVMEKFIDSLHNFKNIQDIRYNMISQKYVSHPCDMIDKEKKG
jgi:DNA-binding Lrp family transcriptional regulator